MVFYGGINKINKIEYSSDYFKGIHNLLLYENKIRKTIKNDPNIDIEDITDLLDIDIIPNIEKVYYIELYPNKVFDINTYVKDNSLMIIFNHSKNNIYINGYTLNYKKNPHIIDKQNMRVNKKTDITLFIMKKPFWFN